MIPEINKATVQQ